MTGADLWEDSFAGHGTTVGYEAGCRSLGGCPGPDGPWGQTCMTAKSRSRMEFGYNNAVANGCEAEFLQAEAEVRTEAVRPSSRIAAAKRRQRKQHGVPEVTESYDDPSVPDVVVDAAADVVLASLPDEVPTAGPTEVPRPRGKQVLDDAVRTLAESLELQRAVAEIGERALRTIRIEINNMRREAAALENQEK